MCFRFFQAIGLGLLLAAGAAQAEAPPAAPEAPASAAPPAMAAPVYRSAFDGYRRYEDAQPVPWRQANDEVARIGGWRSYAREAQGLPPAPAASAPAAHQHPHGGQP